MFSIKECKKVLCSKGKKYTDEEVEKIREYLYKMARVVSETKNGISNEKSIK